MLNIVTGQTQEHLTFDKELNRFFHSDIHKDFLALKNLAKTDGIDLYVLSSFRSFSDQLKIWNAKATGQRDILDDEGNALEFKELSHSELLFAILRWSAIPGTSRHHFGTDLDIVDKATWPADYEVQLVPEEFNSGGHFNNFRNWIDRQLEENSEFKFFRPYQKDQGGVCEEMWHLSHREVSRRLSDYYSLEKFNEFLNLQSPKGFELLEVIKQNSDEIYHRYIANICD